MIVLEIKLKIHLFDRVENIQTKGEIAHYVFKCQILHMRLKVSKSGNEKICCLKWVHKLDSLIV